MAVELNHRIDGSGPHVLLLHAVGMDLTLLDALAAIMAKDFTVLRADLRGHGHSPYVPAASLADYADDVHALLDQTVVRALRGRGLRDGRHGDAGARREISAGHARADDRLVRASSRRRRAAPRCCRAPPSASATASATILDVTMQRWFNDGFIARGGDAAVRERLLDDDVDGWVRRLRTRWRRSIPRRD